MNIKQLEIFVNIVATGSFSKGADTACITQSTASQHIAALEEHCGVRLIDRTGRGAVPTEAGKIMLVQAQQVLRSLKDAKQAMLQFRKGDGVELAVGGSTIPGTYLLPKAIAVLRATDPGVTVKLEIGDSSQILSLLREEHIEIGIVGTTVDDRQIVAEALGHDLIILVARKGHAWAGRTAVLPVELLAEPMVMRVQGSGTNAVVVAALREHGIRTDDLNVSATVTSSEAIKQTVLAGCGVAFISEMAVRQEIERGELAVINLQCLTIQRSFSLMRRKGRTLSPAAAAFERIMRSI